MAYISTFILPTQLPGQRVQSSKFIPVTRRQLLHGVVEEDGLLSPGEKRNMEGLAAALDAHFSDRFYTSLAEAKVSWYPSSCAVYVCLRVCLSFGSTQHL